MSMPMFLFQVDNLKCGGCASTIRKRLGMLPFVSTVMVEPEEGTVFVTHDGSGTRDEVAALLHTLGYPEQGTGGLVQKAKSFVSCAVGRMGASRATSSGGGNGKQHGQVVLTLGTPTC